MANEIVTLKVEKDLYSEIKNYYSANFVNAKGDYIDFMAKFNGIVITGYLSKKETSKITFQGEDASKEALLWDENAKVNTPKEVVKEHWIDFNNQIGSDEVGVGDFLLPMIVCAALVEAKDIKYLMELGIHDSKKMTDATILEVGPKLVEHFTFSKLTLPNSKYNEMIQKGENLNSLKAKMHNRALANLYKDNQDIYAIYVDQFVNEKKYYDYLTKDDEPIVKDIAFKTKGESYFPCVALASVIARYSFLKEKEKLEEKYNMSFPCGSGVKADAFAKEFINKFGLLELEKIAKTNFANYKKIIESI